MHRIYENNEIAVFWNSDKCIHSGKCFQGSPKTFDPGRKPWIQLGLADNPEVWQTVEQCPSGALTIQSRLGVDVVMEADKRRSAAYDGDHLVGECDYRVTESGWLIYHTEVDQDYGGRGIAKRLVYSVLEAAERNKVNVSATCSYAVKILND